MNSFFLLSGMTCLIGGCAVRNFSEQAKPKGIVAAESNHEQTRNTTSFQVFTRVEKENGSLWVRRTECVQKLTLDHRGYFLTKVYPTNVTNETCNENPTEVPRDVFDKEMSKALKRFVESNTNQILLKNAAILANRRDGLNMELEQLKLSGTEENPLAAASFSEKKEFLEEEISKYNLKISRILGSEDLNKQIEGLEANWKSLDFWMTKEAPFFLYDTRLPDPGDKNDRDFTEIIVQLGKVVRSAFASAALLYSQSTSSDARNLKPSETTWLAYLRDSIVSLDTVRLLQFRKTEGRWQGVYISAGLSKDLGALTDKSTYEKMNNPQERAESGCVATPLVDNDSMPDGTTLDLMQGSFSGRSDLMALGAPQPILLKSTAINTTKNSVGEFYLECGFVESFNFEVKQEMGIFGKKSKFFFRSVTFVQETSQHTGDEKSRLSEESSPKFYTLKNFIKDIGTSGAWGAFFSLKFVE
jgi:hypothetical protein